MLIMVLFVWNGWSQNSITQGASKAYTVKFNVGESTGATFSWEITPSVGSSTNVTVVTGNTATIKWDGPAGLYSLSVQVTDGNGCLSEYISKSIEILAPGKVTFAQTLPGTIICSDLSGNADGSSSGHSESLFRVVYSGDSNLKEAGISIKNPAGVFVDLEGKLLADQSSPTIIITNNSEDKEIDFSVSDSWENTSVGNAEFVVTLLSAITADDSVIEADPVTDVTRTIIVLEKPVIGFE